MYPEYTSKFPELGFYGLPGHTRSPRDIVRQVQDAEELGVGNVMISERADYKESASICAACAAVSESIYIGTSGTNANTRHPLTIASMGSTLNALSEGRFAFGIAKGMREHWKNISLPYPTFAYEEEFIHLMRRLWRGETVTNHSGLLGDFASLRLAPYVNADIPMLFVGFGPKGLIHAGRVYDGAHLHTFLSDEALSRAVGHFRQGEKEAGKTPGRGKIWSVLATACDVDEATYLKFIVARLATYLQIPHYGEILVKVNGWDMGILKQFRQHRAVTAIPGAIDSLATTAQLAEIAKIIPEHWMPAAVGDAKTCARRFVDQLDAGADGIIIHASTPEEFAPVLAEYEKIRPTERLAGRTNRPGA